MNQNEYDEIYKIDMRSEWLNSAYDENGNAVLCDLCGEEMKWNPRKHIWFCPDCGQEMSRAVYFNHIGADFPGRECLTNCRENYPICKRSCERFSIDPDDPMRA